MANPIRPAVPLVNGDDVEHRRQLAMRANAALMHDGSNAMTEPLVLAASTVADLPDASLWERGIIYVTDETGGAVPAFSDGVEWRRLTDRAVVSD